MFLTKKLPLEKTSLEISVGVDVRQSLNRVTGATPI